MRSFRSRLISGIGSNAYAQSISILIQLFSFPVFLRHWSIEQYGVWILMSTVPAYFAVADLGIISVAGNKMTMLRASRNMDHANVVFQTATLFVVAACSALFLAVVASVFLASSQWFDVGRWRETLLLLVATALLNLACGVFEAIFRASLQYASGTALLGSARLVEWAGSILALEIEPSLFSAAAGAFVARAVCCVFLYAAARRRCGDFSWGVRRATRAEMRLLALPAASFMLFPIGTAISMQGMLMVVGAALGPAAVAIFAAYRTLSRVVVQAIGVGSHALAPEFSLLYGRRDFAGLGATYQRAARVGYAFSFAVSIGVCLLAEPFLRVWTHGKVPFDVTFLWLSVASTFVAGAWHVSRIVLLSTNQHARISLGYLACSLLSIPLAFTLTRSVGLAGAFIASIVFEGAMFLIARSHAKRFLVQIATVPAVA